MKIWDRNMILRLLLVNDGTFHRIIYRIIPCFLSHIASHISQFSVAFFPRPWLSHCRYFDFCRIEISTHKSWQMCSDKYCGTLSVQTMRRIFRSKFWNFYLPWEWFQSCWLRLCQRCFCRRRIFSLLRFVRYFWVNRAFFRFLHFWRDLTVRF